MSKAVLITTLDYSPQDLRERSKVEKASLASRRLLALALCLEQVPRQHVALSCGLNSQALRDLVVRYNVKGLAAIHNAKGHPRPNARLSEEQTAKLCTLIEAGADLARDGVVRYRRVDVVRVIEREFGVVYSARGVGHMLKRLGFSYMSARPKHPSGDEAAREAFKKTSLPM